MNGLTQTATGGRGARGVQVRHAHRGRSDQCLPDLAAGTGIARRVGARRRDERRTWQGQHVLTIFPQSSSSTVRYLHTPPQAELPRPTDAGGPHEGWGEMSFLGGLRRHFPLPAEGHMPGFDGATGWLNSPPLTAEDLRAKVVLVDFWTYTCINWLRTLAYVRAWAEKYRGSGLLVVGVHTPEFPFEREIDNVRQAANDLNVWYPIALDSNYEVWQAFSNRYWPAVYIADAEGRIRHHQFGEGGYDDCERGIQQLLREAGAESVPDDLVSVTPTGFEAQADWTNLRSPETYVGYAQSQSFASKGGPGRRSSRHVRTARHVDAQPMGARRGLDGRKGQERAERAGMESSRSASTREMPIS